MRVPFLLYCAVYRSSDGWICRLTPASTLACCLAYSSVLEIEATCSSETSVDFRRATRRYLTWKDRKNTIVANLCIAICIVARKWLNNDRFLGSINAICVPRVKCRFHSIGTEVWVRVLHCGCMPTFRMIHPAHILRTEIFVCTSQHGRAHGFDFYQN
jgi:hypothetical protein